MYTMNNKLNTENIKFLKLQKNSRFFPEIRAKYRDKSEIEKKNKR